MKVPYSYLVDQFAPVEGVTDGLNEKIMAAIREESKRGAYTLGPQVEAFEEAIAEKLQASHAIGVSNGTDALFLILKALGFGTGDTVFVPANTFLATAGAVLQAGCNVRFTDVDDQYLMNSAYSTSGYNPVDRYINAGHGYHEKVGIIPVHWGGAVAENICAPGTYRIDDAAQAVLARDSQGHIVGSDAAGAIASAFSMHPLKNLNVMGDGGFITTNDAALAWELRLLRNHGLDGRDIWVKPGYNMRLSTIQAIVALEVLPTLDWITESRRINAATLDNRLQIVHNIIVPPRTAVEHAHHLYQFEVGCSHRNDLLKELQGAEIEAKVHYPVPLPLQPALRHLGNKPGDFPRAELFAARHITLPIHQYLSEGQVDFMVDRISNWSRSHYCADSDG